MKRALLVAAVVFLAACGSAGTATSSPPFCKGAQLGGTFKVVPGSAGAGNIVYRLRITNHSTATCFVSGLPAVRLLGATGNPLPTHTTPAQPGMGTAARIVLAPGRHAHADVRFSPDVPGPGEGAPKQQCEPTAHFLRVTAPGGGSFDAAVKPPTPVCSHGALQLGLYTAG